MKQNETLFSKYLFIEGLQSARHQKKVCVKLLYRKFVLKATEQNTNCGIIIHFGGFKIGYVNLAFVT